MTLKQIVHQQFLLLTRKKVDDLEKVLADLKEAGANETKSTAGDKHETALAMVQIEQANVRAQLEEGLKQLAAIDRLDPSLSPPMVVIGSLVKTNKGYFFICAALGMVSIEGVQVVAISPQSPLGSKLIGCATRSEVAVNQQVFVVEQVL